MTKNSLHHIICLVPPNLQSVHLKRMARATTWASKGSHADPDVSAATTTFNYYQQNVFSMFSVFKMYESVGV